MRANRNRKFVDSPLEGTAFEPSVPRTREKFFETPPSDQSDKSLALAGYGLGGVSETTAGTPSGLMLKARKVNGSLPGLPHWWTRPKGS